MQEITKIALTGGPCSGKTTAKSWLQNAFTQLGYRVLFIEETATELISGGISPITCKTNLDFQKCQMQLQAYKEEIFYRAAKVMNDEKILIVCDRGFFDSKAYMSDKEFAEILETMGTNEVKLRDSYDAVFHLVSAAKGAEAFYTLKGNQARTETVEEAAILDDKIISAWTGHSHLRIIDNSTDFESKLRRLLFEVTAFLGEPVPFEIERKYLIEYPNIEMLEKDPYCKKIDIIQTYLKSTNGDEIRVRQRGFNGNYVFFQTTKKQVSNVKRVEVEKRLTQSQYLTLLMEADTSRRQIRKTRYCLTYKGQYFEIDVYPFWNHQAIMEIELSNEDTAIEFPPHVKIIKEVTDDKSYSNYALSAMNGSNE